MATQPITIGEIAKFAEIISEFNVDHQQDNGVNEIVALMNDNILSQGAWFIVGVRAPTPDTYHEMRKAIVDDQISSFFLYQVGKLCYCIHK